MPGSRRSSISPMAALMFQGVIGVVGALAIWLFSIPVFWQGMGTLTVLLFGALGAVATYLALLLITRIPRLFPDTLEQQMVGLYQFARSYTWPVLFLLCVLAGGG